MTNPICRCPDSATRRAAATPQRMPIRDRLPVPRLPFCAPLWPFCAFCVPPLPPGFPAEKPADERLTPLLFLPFSRPPIQQTTSNRAHPAPPSPSMPICVICGSSPALSVPIRAHPRFHLPPTSWTACGLARPRTKRCSRQNAPVRRCSRRTSRNDRCRSLQPLALCGFRPPHVKQPAASCPTPHAPRHIPLPGPDALPLAAVRHTIR